MGKTVAAQNSTLAQNSRARQQKEHHLSKRKSKRGSKDKGKTCTPQITHINQCRQTTNVFKGKKTLKDKFIENLQLLLYQGKMSATREI